jgi:hypothetical protein
MTPLWIRGASVVDHRGAYRADVVIRGARVEALGVVRPFGPFEELDAAGLWLLGGTLDGGRFVPGEKVRAGGDADLIAVSPEALDASQTEDAGAAMARAGGPLRDAVCWAMVRGELEDR